MRMFIRENPVIIFIATVSHLNFQIPSRLMNAVNEIDFQESDRGGRWSRI